MVQSLSALYDAAVAAGTIRDDPEQRAALALLQPILAWASRPERPGLSDFLLRALHRSPPPPKGLYLWGEVGTGKSMLMDLFIAAVPGRKRRVHFHAFMQEVQAGLEAARRQGLDDALRPVAGAIGAQARVLAFDEMEITDIADAVIVGRLFQLLLDAGVVIVTTSNQPPGGLYRDGLNRALFLPFVAMLESRLDVHHLGHGIDYRQNRLALGRAWMVPADGSARAAVDRLWTDLAGGPGEPMALTLMGRSLVLSEARNGIARARFRDLCGQPLGPADYLAIAAALRVLILEDIPELSSENYNQARRFVLLIDALYEARVRLVATAAAWPEQLYLEGEGSLAFARTASRLREMMADDWTGKPAAAPHANA